MAKRRVGYNKKVQNWNILVSTDFSTDGRISSVKWDESAVFFDGSGTINL